MPSNSRNEKAFVSLVLALLGIVLTWVAVHNLRDEIRICVSKGEVRAHGKTTVGTITSCEAQTKTYGMHGHSYTYYIHTVQYDGFTTTFHEFRPIPPGSRIPVVYMANDPQNMIVGKVSQSVEDMRRRWGDVFGVGFGTIIYLIVGLVGVGFLGCALLVIVPKKQKKDFEAKS